MQSFTATDNNHKCSYLEGEVDSATVELAFMESVEKTGFPTPASPSTANMTGA